MQKILTTISILILLFILVATPSWGVSEAGQSATRPVRLAPLPDPRVAKLEKFLKRVNSPLAPKAQVFIAKADQYELPDWKMLPAITGVESTFGKAIPSNSYNAYGWANGNYYFKNWDESIDTVSKTLKTNYINLFIKNGVDGKKDFLVGILPGVGGDPIKRWAPEKFARLADYLAGKHKAKIFILGAVKKIESWNPDNYEKYLKENVHSHEQIANEVMKMKP